MYHLSKKIKSSLYSLNTLSGVTSAGTRLYGATTLALPIWLWSLLALPILLLLHFGADLFGANFMKMFFFFF